MDKKSCEESPAKTNCALYQRGFCKSCSTGYILNYSLSSQKLLRFDTTEQKRELSNTFNEIVLGNEGLKYAPVCQKIDVQNCMFPVNATTCGFCELGYILLENRTCQRFPIPAILNCQKYLHPLKCLKCTNRYFLKNDTECEPVTEIQNCSIYDGEASSSVCQECSLGYYST